MKREDDTHPAVRALQVLGGFVLYFVLTMIYYGFTEWFRS